MTYEMYLSHHGIKGQKWGVRRYQNPDGSLTAAGKKRYHSDSSTLGVYTYLSKRGGESLSTSEKISATKLIRKAQKDGLTSEKEEQKLENIISDITPNVLSDEIKNQKSRLLLDSKEGWIETLKARKEYEDLLNRSLSDVGLDKYYKAGAFVSQHYEDLTAPMYLKKSKNGKFEDPDFVKEDPDLSKFGVTRWFNGYDTLKDYYNASDKVHEDERERRKVKHSEEGEDFKMTNNFIELSEVFASLDPEYLEHHGIKGMSWGVHRGPPYPLQSGIRTKIKKVTQAAKNRVEANQKQRAARQEAKEARRRRKNPTLQDRINAMSDEELRKRTERLRLENAYKRELPRETEGKTFLRSVTDKLNSLKALGDAVSGLAETGKKFGKAFGLDKLDGDDESPTRMEGESIKDYTVRMKWLATLKESKDKLGLNDSNVSKETKKEETPSSSPTSTAKTRSSADPSSYSSWRKDRANSGSYDYDPSKSDLSGLREEAKRWNVDLDKPAAEKSWTFGDAPKSRSTNKDVDTYARDARNWFKDSFPEVNRVPFSDFVKDDDDDEKKKKGG